VKYEKYMEKKRRKELKKEREILEKQLEQDTQDARLMVRSNQDAGTADEGIKTQYSFIL
jgi:tRNA(Ser,Leu) C12 N-acetylase TAN1